MQDLNGAYTQVEQNPLFIIYHLTLTLLTLFIQRTLLFNLDCFSYLDIKCDSF